MIGDFKRVVERKIFKNRLLRRIFIPNREKVRGSL
jgi:hypothetical protein